MGCIQFLHPFKLQASCREFQKQSEVDFFHRLPETTLSGNIKWCKVWKPHQPLKNFSRSLAKRYPKVAQLQFAIPEKVPRSKSNDLKLYHPLDNLQKYITGLPNTYHQCENHQWGSAHRRWIRIALRSHNALVPQEFCLKPGVGHGFCGKYGKVASKSPWGLRTQWPEDGDFYN